MNTNFKKVYTIQRLIDTLKKYDGHKIIDINNYGDYIIIKLEYNSNSKKSKTLTEIRVYIDDYNDYIKENKNEWCN